MPAMKKKNKKNYLTVAVIALIILSVAAIGYVVLLYQEEPVGIQPSPLPKKQATQPSVAPKQLPEKSKTIVSPPIAGKIPDKQKVVVAKTVPPRLSTRQIAIIIDDIGNDLKPVRELLRIDAEITFAILPLVAHSREAARMLHQAHRETLLHLPMEPLSYPKEKPGNGALFTDMNEEEIIFQLEKDLASVPHVTGVNNHMGSKFMADETKLTPVFKQLKKRDLFFVDSRTTSSSKTAAVSEKVHLTVASRKIFLDNERDYHKIYQILMEAAETPAGNAPLIVIGHPHPETIRAIRDACKVFQEKGIAVVPVSKLIKKQTSDDAS